MQLEQLSQRGLSIPRQLFGAGTNTFGRLATFHREFLGQTGELFFPKRTPEQFVKDLETFEPLHDAEVGFSAIEHGERKGDWELVYFGGAMAVKAMVFAYEKSKIPSFVTKAIVGGVIEHHIVPAEQPLLSDELVMRSEPPIKKYGETVLELFPSIENRL